MAVIGQYAVYLRDEDGTVHTFLQGQEVPEWAAKQMGDHCFAHTEHVHVPVDSSGGDEADPPPRAGAGSGRDHWAAYAEANGVDVDNDWKRDQIIDACREAGVPVE